MAKWVKGQSGNPGGRPKEIGDVKVLARQHTPEAIQTLADIMTDTEAPPAARVAAANGILDRGYGRAPASLKVEGTPESTIIAMIKALDDKAQDKTSDEGTMH